jgi:hypothetical protein
MPRALKPVRVMQARFSQTASGCDHLVLAGGQIVGILQPDGKTRRWVCMACRLDEIRARAGAEAGR